MNAPQSIRRGHGICLVRVYLVVEMVLQYSEKTKKRPVVGAGNRVEDCSAAAPW